MLKYYYSHSKNECGNNNYKMLAIYDEEHTYEETIENMEILKDYYIIRCNMRGRNNGFY